MCKNTCCRQTNATTWKRLSLIKPQRLNWRWVTQALYRRNVIQMLIFISFSFAFFPIFFFASTLQFLLMFDLCLCCCSMAPRPNTQYAQRISFVYILFNYISVFIRSFWYILISELSISMNCALFEYNNLTFFIIYRCYVYLLIFFFDVFSFSLAIFCINLFPLPFPYLSHYKHPER